MPSRPMFTTPERSDHRPPRPAMPMGIAKPMAAAIVPGESICCAPVTTRTNDSTAMSPAMSSARRQLVNVKVRFCRAIGLTTSPGVGRPSLVPVAAFWPGWGCCSLMRSPPSANTESSCPSSRASGCNCTRTPGKQPPWTTSTFFRATTAPTKYGGSLAAITSAAKTEPSWRRNCHSR